MKLGLGTVQFGLSYGVSNNVGRPILDEIRRILSVAREAGIRVLDTAASYGESESILGELTPGVDPSFDVVTKFAPSQKAETAADDFGQQLDHLHRNSVYGLMVHRAEDLLEEQGAALFSQMRKLRDAGRVKKIGASIYTAAQIDAILDQFEIEIVQVPINVLDQRLIESGHLKKLKDRGVEIHARSIFLQGLLLMDPSETSNYFGGLRTRLQLFRDEAHQAGMDPLQACLAFALGVPEVDSVICGVNSARELGAIVAAAGSSRNRLDFARFSVDEEKYLNPSLWPKRD